MAAHTPGPWHRNITPATKYPTVWSGRNNHVAYVDTMAKTPAEVEANLQLITLAPTLFDLLDQIVNSADDEGCSEDLTVVDRGPVNQAYDLIMRFKMEQTL